MDAGRDDRLTASRTQLAQHRAIGVLPRCGRRYGVSGVPPVRGPLACAPVTSLGDGQKCWRRSERLRSVEVDINEPAGRLSEEETDVLLPVAEVALEVGGRQTQPLPSAESWSLLAARNRDWQPAPLAVAVGRRFDGAQRRRAHPPA